MRSLFLSSAFVVFACLAGCGDKPGPVDPAQVTPEQEQKMKEAQKQVDAEERQQQAKQGGGPKTLSPEQEVEMQERSQQRR